MAKVVESDTMDTLAGCGKHMGGAVVVGGTVVVVISCTVVVGPDGPAGQDLDAQIQPGLSQSE